VPATSKLRKFPAPQPDSQISQLHERLTNVEDSLSELRELTEQQQSAQSRVFQEQRREIRGELSTLIERMAVLSESLKPNAEAAKSTRIEFRDIILTVSLLVNLIAVLVVPTLSYTWKAAQFQTRTEDRLKAAEDRFTVLKEPQRNAKPVRKPSPLGKYTEPPASHSHR